MNRKVKTIFSIVDIAIAVLITLLISGCYLKDNSDVDLKYYNQGKNISSLTEEDLSQFASSMRKIDGEAVAHYKMALYFQKQRKHKLAIEELKQAVQRDSSYAKAYNAMGVSYDKLRNHSRAIDCYRRALIIDPKLDYTHNNLGYSYLLSNNLDAAVESFQKAIQLNGSKKRYRNNLALVYVMKDRYDKAIDQLKVLEGGPHAGETVAKLAHKLGKKNFEKQIVSVLERMRLERTLTKDAKSALNKSAVIHKKIYNEETNSSRRNPVVISEKNEQPAPEKINLEFADNLTPNATELAGPNTSNNVMSVEEDTSDSKYNESKDPYAHKHKWDSLKEMFDTIAQQAENNPVISVISEADKVPVLEVRDKPDTASKDEQQRANGDQKIFDQSILLATVEMNSEPALEKSDKHIVEVEIANGNGVNGMAARVRNFLKENGIKVSKISNANSFDHLSTKIFYCNGHLQDVDRIIQKIVCCADERNIIELKNLGNRIKIIVGKDLIPQYRSGAKRGVYKK